MKKQMPNLFGLNEKELLILRFSKTPSGLAHLSRKTALPRSTAEYLIKSLVSRKFLVCRKQGKRKFYQEVPQRYLGANLMDATDVMTIGPITIYKGVNAIDSLWQEIADHPKESRLTAIQPRKSFREAIRKGDKKMVRDISQELTDKKFIIDAIVHEDLARSIFERYQKPEAYEVAKAFVGRSEDTVKVDVPFLDEKAEMFLIEDNCIFIDWFQEIAVKIESRNINQFLLAVYQAVKAYGTRYAQSEFIEKLLEKSKSKK